MKRVYKVPRSFCATHSFRFLPLFFLLLCQATLAFSTATATATTINTNTPIMNPGRLAPQPKRRKVALSSSVTNENHNNSNNDNHRDENDDGSTVHSKTSSSSDNSVSEVGKLKALKQREAELAAQLAAVRREKLNTIRSRPLTIGIIGFGRFGQFIARTFCKYAGKVVVTSRTDYTEIANGMGVTYIPLDQPDKFLQENLDVIVFCVSIVSFKSTIKSFVPHLEKYLKDKRASDENGSSTGPLMVDVLSVKEHARKVMIDMLPEECDILCTHPMFGPDSGKNGWQNLNFVYEKTRIDKVLLDPNAQQLQQSKDTFRDVGGVQHSVHEDSEAHVEGMDRMERFLSIWEEEGCRMVPMSCQDHDAYAANSQFITHLVGRVLGNQGLSQTPIDTSGFQSVLKLIDSTTADSFELFYGLYKYNENSGETIKQLQSAMNDVVSKLKDQEQEEQEKQVKRTQ